MVGWGHFSPKGDLSARADGAGLVDPLARGSAPRRLAFAELVVQQEAGARSFGGEAVGGVGQGHRSSDRQPQPMHPRQSVA